MPRTPTSSDGLAEGHPAPLANVLERNIDALIQQRRLQEQQRNWQDRLADGIGRFTGSMPFVYLHLLLFGLWIAINLGALAGAGIEPFDPTFVILAMAASVEAIFLSTFVLITQNRMAALAERRAELDLQISLLAEHEITRLIRLTSAMAQKLGVDDAHDATLSELAEDVAPERVIERLAEKEADGQKER